MARSLSSTTRSSREALLQHVFGGTEQAEDDSVAARLENLAERRMMERQRQAALERDDEEEAARLQEIVERKSLAVQRKSAERIGVSDGAKRSARISSSVVIDSSCTA